MSQLTIRISLFFGFKPKEEREGALIKRRDSIQWLFEYRKVYIDLFKQGRDRKTLPKKMSARHGQPRPSNGGHRPAPLSEQGRRGPPNNNHRPKSLGGGGGRPSQRRASSKNRHSDQQRRNQRGGRDGRQDDRARDRNGRYTSRRGEEERRTNKPRVKEWRHAVDPVYLSRETGFPLQANAEIYETVDFSRYQFDDISPILVDFFKLTSRPGTVDLEAPPRTGIGLIPVIARLPNGEEKMRGDIPSSKATYIGGHDRNNNHHDSEHQSSRHHRHGHRDDRHSDDDYRISAEDIRKGRHHHSSSSGRKSQSRGRHRHRSGGRGGEDDNGSGYSSGQNSSNYDSQSGSQTGSYDSQDDDYYSSGGEEEEGEDDYDSYEDGDEEGQDDEYGVRATQASQYKQHEHELYQKQQSEEAEHDAAMAAQYANMAAQQKRQKVFQYKKLLHECRNTRNMQYGMYVVPDPENESIGTLADLIFNMSDAKTKHDWIAKRTTWLSAGGMALTFANKMLFNSKIGLEPNDDPESNTFIGKWASGVAACHSEFDRLFETQLQQKGSMAAMRDNPYVSMGMSLGQSVFKEHSKNRWGFDMDKYLDSGVLQDGPNQGVLMYPPQPPIATPSDPNVGHQPPPAAAAPTPQTYTNPANTYPANNYQPAQQPHRQSQANTNTLKCARKKTFTTTAKASRFANRNGWCSSFTKKAQRGMATIKKRHVYLTKQFEFFIFTLLTPLVQSFVATWLRPRNPSPDHRHSMYY